jgi:hypothetical protein
MENEGDIVGVDIFFWYISQPCFGWSIFLIVVFGGVRRGISKYHDPNAMTDELSATYEGGSSWWSFRYWIRNLMTVYFTESSQL